jgi:hypothetical protein
MYIAIANAIYSSLLQGSRGGFPQACFGLDYNAITSDFTFTRNSFATRVNEFGLIETVTDLGSDLVQNGSFDELGPELVVNGDFATDSDWSKLNATISDGKGNLDGDGQTSLLYQDILTNGKTYKVTFTVSDYNSLGNSEIINTNGGNIFTIPSNGTFTVYFTHSVADGNIYWRAISGAIYSIDNVSVKQVDPNDDWEQLGVGITITDKANFDGSGATVNFRQVGVVTATNTYKVTYTVGDYSQGNLQMRVGGTYGTARTANGTYTDTLTAANGNFQIYGFSNFIGSIDNIIVKEVLEDDVPRIDYSTGEAAFLLEPISTNSVDYSEDFSNIYWTKLGTPTITDNYGTSPDGTQNSTRVQGNSLTVIYVSNGAANTNFSRSIYIKATSGSGTIQALSHNSNTNNVFSIDENWQRVEINSLTSSTGDVVVYAIDMRGASTDIFDVEIWGCQEERGIDYATSYIPTSGTTVTRAQETCVDATPTINSEEGVLYAEISALADSGGLRLFSLNDGSTSNIIQIFYSNTSNRITTELKVSGSTEFAFNYILSDVTDFNKIAFKYKENDFALWVNGVEVYTDTLGTTFTEGTLSELDFDNGSGSFPFYGRTKDLRIYCKVLTDEQLTELTTI